MAGSVNKVVLLGNLGQDPEVRNTQAGDKIVTLSVATSDRWKDKASGETRERTEWHRVVIFNEGLAGIAERYLRKGSKVYLEGALQTRKWTGNDGADKYTTEVVLQRYRGELVLLSGGDGGGSTRGVDAGERAMETARKAAERRPDRAAPPLDLTPGGVRDLDDDIPF